MTRRLLYGFLLTSHFLFFFAETRAQDEHGFPFGQATYRELGITAYEKDTSAAAVVLNEFGEAYMDSQGNYNLIFRYHARIKILKKPGLGHADIEIPLRKQGPRMEMLRSIKAASYSMENGSMRQTPLDDRDVFTVNHSRYIDLKKFAIPNVRVGSVIEFEYILESPLYSTSELGLSSRRYRKCIVSTGLPYPATTSIT